MDVVGYLLLTPVGTALVVGGLFLVILRRFLYRKGKSDSNLPPLPGKFILLMNAAGI